MNEGITSTVQSRISSCSKLLRVTAWMMRWIKIVKKQVDKKNLDATIACSLSRRINSSRSSSYKRLPKDGIQRGIHGPRWSHK